jgi:hypothetical protein
MLHMFSGPNMTARSIQCLPEWGAPRQAYSRHTAHRTRAVGHGVELVEAAGLKARRHQQHVDTCRRVCGRAGRQRRMIPHWLPELRCCLYARML